MDLPKIYSLIKKQISSIDFEILWPDFHPYDFAVYNDYEVCLNGILIPKTDDFLANTAIFYKGKWTAIFAVGEVEDIDILTSKIIHEMFHAFQLENNESRFPNELEAIQKHEYTVENLTAKLHENRLLVKVLKDGFDKKLWNELLMSKKHRMEKHNYSYMYEAKAEQIEGTANYIELISLQNINEEKYQIKLEKMMSSIGKTESLFPIRISLYNSGALLIKLLKEKMIFFNHGFSELPFSVSILDTVDYKDVSYNDDNEVIKSIDHYYQSLDELIDWIRSA